MTIITRSWLSFAAIGAGIIHLALVTGSPLPIAVALAFFGVAELSWGVAILAKGRLVTPRLAQSGAIVPLLLWSLLTVTATLLAAPAIASPLKFVPMGIASVFELFIALVLSRSFRRAADAVGPERSSAPVGAGRYLATVIAAGILVGALTTPALAATEAGAVAAHHGGTMGGMSGMSGMPGLGR